MKQLPKLRGKHLPHNWTSTLSLEQIQLSLWAKQMELDALKTARNKDSQPDPVHYYCYWDAKACAFSQVWQQILFKDRELHPAVYNQTNEIWCNAIEKELEDVKS